MGSSPSAPASPPAVTLHIGAHKTASTHLQKLFLAHSDALLSRGCAYFGPEMLRKRRVKNTEGTTVNRLRRSLDAARTAGQSVLLSDENILGRPRPPFIADGGRLYPQAAPRVAAFVSGLGLTEVTLALSLRDPLAFLISAHGHQAMAGHPVSFDDFANGIDPLALRWSEVIARLLEYAGAARIILWRYEDYPRIAPNICAALSGDPYAAQILTADSGPQLTGISEQAFQRAQALLAKDPQKNAKKTVKHQMRRFPKSAQYPPLQPFSPACIAQSLSQYQLDWAHLATLPRVTCLAP